MIEKLFSHPHVFHQTPDNKDDMPELPLAVSMDATGLIILSQEKRQLCINRASVPELCSLLKQMEKKTP